MNKSFINSDHIDSLGTSLVDEIEVSYRKLVKTFGKETFGMSDDNKCECNWQLLFEDGTVATIYDYKINKKYCGQSGVCKSKNTAWHIGGFDEKASELVKKELGII